MHDTMKIFFYSNAAYKILSTLSTDNNLKRQYKAFMETLFSGSFLGKKIPTPHHLNSKVWFLSLSNGIVFIGSIMFFLYFFRRVFPNDCKFWTKSLAKNYKSLYFLSPYFVGKYSTPF